MGKHKENRMSWRPKSNNDERHKGSYDLDQLKLTEEYKSAMDLISKDGEENNKNKVKRKFAICFGYLGTNYRGLQINPDTESVERELEKAY